LQKFKVEPADKRIRRYKSIRLLMTRDKNEQRKDAKNNAELYTGSFKKI